MSDASGTIAFQGAPGAYSDLACRKAKPGMTTLPCATFEEAFAAVREGRAELAMIPIDNSVAGRVADIHHLLPESGLHIIGEHFQPVVHHLLAPRRATLVRDQIVLRWTDMPGSGFLRSCRWAGSPRLNILPT